MDEPWWEPGEQSFWVDRKAIVAEVEGTSREEILYVLAQCYWQQGQVCRAIEVFQQAEQIAPHLGKASNALGVFYWQLGWIGEARQQIERALQRDPDDGDALVNGVSLYLREGGREASTGTKNEEDIGIVRGQLERAACLQPHRLSGIQGCCVIWVRLMRCRRL